MTIDEHMLSFAGRKIREASQHADIDPQYAYRVTLDWDEHEQGKTFSDVFKAFMARSGVDTLRAMVVGCWSHEMGDDLGSVLDDLEQTLEKLPQLEALFLGDITYEEQECSWIQQGDVSRALSLFPKLIHLGARGSDGLTWRACEHQQLETLRIESGGIGSDFIRSLAESKLANLHHLELWMGEENYGGVEAEHSVVLFDAFAQGKFPALTYLGLRNAEYADEIVGMLAKRRLPEHIQTLDVSLGCMTKVGVEAFVQARNEGRLPGLRQLLIHQNYISESAIAQLQATGIELGGDLTQKSSDDEDEDDRYVTSVSRPHNTPTLLLGCAQDRRVQGFAEAWNRLGGSCTILPHFRLLPDARRLATYLTPGTMLRIESFGPCAMTRRALVQLGWELGAPRLSGQIDEVGEIWETPALARGWQAYLARIGQIARDHSARLVRSPGRYLGHVR